jgi:hypothetical protein
MNTQSRLRTDRRSLSAVILLGLSLVPSLSAAVVSWGDISTDKPMPLPDSSARNPLSPGYWHNVAVGSSGNAIAWGLNSFGQTNVPIGLGKIFAIAARNAFTSRCAVTARCDNFYDRLMVPTRSAMCCGEAMKFVPLVGWLASKLDSSPQDWHKGP